MIRVYLVVIGLVVSNLAQGQVVLEGIVLDSVSREPLSFATVGISGTTLGTATNVDGRFVMEVSDAYSDSLLFVSYMGYGTYFRRVDDFEERSEVLLVYDDVVLEEVEVRPWEAWKYIEEALKHIPENYLSSAFLTTNYYNEYISEDQQFIKFTEGVIETYNPAYGDTSRITSRLIQARTRDDLANIAFMRERLERKMSKAVKKAKKKGERIDFETLDEAVLSSSFGGPRQILREDPIRDTASFLNPVNRKYYAYELGGYSTYHDQKVVIINFESTKKLDYQLKKGSIYITLDTDAIVAIEFESKMIIPDIARPVMFFYALGATDPEFEMRIHYKPYHDRWYINDISIKGGARLTHKKMFKSNDRSYFELNQMLITTDVDFENARQIPKDERLKNWVPLEDQIDFDPEFWKNYHVVYPEVLN